MKAGVRTAGASGTGVVPCARTSIVRVSVRVSKLPRGARRVVPRALEGARARSTRPSPPAHEGRRPVWYTHPCQPFSLHPSEVPFTQQSQSLTSSLPRSLAPKSNSISVSLYIPVTVPVFVPIPCKVYTGLTSRDLRHVRVVHVPPPAAAAATATTIAATLTADVSDVVAAARRPATVRDHPDEVVPAAATAATTTAATIIA
jgi:hypothetical protein